MSWTDDRVALLTKLWTEGKTAKEIAQTLGGVTRNAVIGKAHRLNLSGRVSPIPGDGDKHVRSSSVTTPEAPVAGLDAKKPSIQAVPLERDRKKGSVSAYCKKLQGNSTTASREATTRSASVQSRPQPLPEGKSRSRARTSSGIGSAVPANINIRQSTAAPEKAQLQDLTDKMCKWPIGDPRDPDFHFCGRTGIPGLSYCEEHAKKAYQTNKRMKLLTPESFETKSSDDDEDQERIA